MSLHSDNRALDQYLREISLIPLITVEEEVELARRVRAGDEEALTKLTEANLRFVVSVARKYQGYGLTLADLINEGNYGLMIAAKRFDETRGFKFISYAIWWVRQAILHAITDQGRLIRLPHNRSGAITKMNRASVRLYQKHQRAPRPEEIARELGVPVEEVRMSMQLAVRHMSIDAPVAGDAEQTYLDILCDPAPAAPDEELEDDSSADELERVLRRLDMREQNVLKLFFGIGYEQAYSLEEVGERLGLNAERVRLIKEKALHKLRWKYIPQMLAAQAS